MMTQDEIRDHFRRLRATYVHSFVVDDAVQYGIVEAIVLYNLRFWIAKNKAKGKNLRDGKTWTYNSQRAFAELFPYLSEGKIQRALAKLEKDEVILKRNYNKVRYDRTSWYAVADESLLPMSIIHDAS